MTRSLSQPLSVCRSEFHAFKRNVTNNPFPKQIRDYEKKYCFYKYDCYQNNNFDFFKKIQKLRYPTDNYMLKVNNHNTRRVCLIRLKSKIMTIDQPQLIHFQYLNCYFKQIQQTDQDSFSYFEQVLISWVISSN